MKDVRKRSIPAFLIAILGLSLVVNCNEKKDDNTGLLLAALALSQQPPTWAVSITADLKEANGDPLAANNSVTLSDRQVDASSNLEKALILSNGETDIRVFATTAAAGRFAVSFRMRKRDTPLQFRFRTLRGGGDPDKIADYTVNAGSANFTFSANDERPEARSQVTGLTVNGKELEIVRVLSVRSGTYNLPNPTVGEQVCDGRRLRGAPRVVSGRLTQAQNWSGGILLQGTVFADAPITVQPGTVIFGARGASLFVRGANKLTAIGTAANPICWTSASAPGSRFPGDWGGIVTIGNAGATRASNTEGTTPQPYGGNNLLPSVRDAGKLNIEMEYNIVEFGGNEVAPGDELNNISMYASVSKLTNVQAHRGLDDQFEQWGGRMTWSKVLATGGLDDDYDLDEGVRGTITNAVSHKYPVECGGTASTDPHALEWDGIHSGENFTCPGGSGDYGCTAVTMNRFALIGTGIANIAAARLREGVDATLNNGVIYGFTIGIDRRGGNGQDATTSVTTLNVRTEASVANHTSTGTTLGTPDTQEAPAFNVVRDLVALPIVSDGGINSENNCGFGASKPDYSLTAAAASAQGPTQGVGKFWEGWAVFRGR
jgi:hypothetical protein